jgi:glycosyltransferase involved in cell wall biosynthesis
MPAILHLISSGGFYGAESMLITLLESLRQTGCRCVLGVFRNTQKMNLEVAERAAAAGVEVELIPCTGRLDWGAVRCIREILGRYGVDLLHTHGYKADLYGFLAARASDVPVMATCHNWTKDTRTVQAYSLLDRFVLRRFRAVTAVSSTVAELLIEAGISLDRIRVIHNGIGTEKCCSPQEMPEILANGHGPVIGMVGRLVPQKGFLDVLACGPEILSFKPDTRFVITGEGPQRAELEQAACNAGISHSVVFTGARADIQCFYAAMDIFVLPSLNEGMPMTVLEAMAAGKPVVASRVGAVPQIVCDGESGILVQPGNRRELKDALVGLLKAPARAIQMGERGRKRVIQEYSSSAMARQYASLYSSLVPAAVSTGLEKR